MQGPPLTPEEKRRLLRWARQAIETGTADVPVEGLTPGLCEPHAAFVTLMKAGELRGCIGQMQYDRPLWENTLEAAVASALEDPRFPPVTPDELGELTLDISVLDPPEDLPRVELFEPLRHGIIVEKGMHHALLLPKVAQDYGWGAEKVLETVCVKAGLPADAWREPGVRLQVFEAYDFSEEECR